MATNLTNVVSATQDDVDFWNQQITEHALFLYQLLNVQVAPRLKDEAVEFYRLWLIRFQQIPTMYDAELLNNFYAFLETVCTEAKHHPNLNVKLSQADFISLLHHMITEQTYFVRLMEGKTTVKDELIFWEMENAEHTELTSHLLPPGQLKVEANNVAEALKENNRLACVDSRYFANELGLLEQSNTRATEIYYQVRAGRLPQIDYIMLEHEMREATRGQRRVAQLLAVL